MKEGMESFKDDLDDLVAKWDKALDKGIFDNAPKLPSTGDARSDFSFFGPRNDNSTDEIKGSDSQYWNAISSLADGGVDMQRLDEADAISINLPNPIRHSTEGKDQDLSPKSLGLTFDEKDVSELEEMKSKLHDLGSKSAEMGEDDHVGKIDALIRKIDDLSDRMGRPKK